MNRKIAFRAWDKENQRWYKPTHEAYKNNLFELLVSFNGDLLSHTMQGINHESIFPDRFELMQHTGLQDKTGRDIFEGDIVRDSERMFEQGVVKFDYDRYIIEGAEEVTVGFKYRHWVVIGNIYENPELLDNK